MYTGAKKAAWAALVLLLVGLAGASAQMMGGGMMGSGYGMMSPDYGRPGYGMMGNDPIERMRYALNLNANQTTQVRNLWLEHIRSTGQTQANLQAAQVELQGQLQAGKNAGQVENQLRQIANLWVELQLADTRYQQQLRNVLTPQQLERLYSHPGFGMQGAPFGPAYGGYGGYRSAPEAENPQAQ